MLQAIRRLLTRPECFRLEREFAGPDFHRGEQCTLARHIHPNPIERTMRPVKLSRKNSLFAGSDEGGAGWARMASLIETCKLNLVNQQRYLTGVLTWLVSGWPQSHIDELMPWHWAPNGQCETSATPQGP